MRKDIPQIGMTYQILNKDGIYDLRAIAKEFYEQKTHLDKLGQWTHDRYLKQSSHARGKVRTESSPYFKDCSVWSINHYLGLNRHPYVIKKAQEATAIYGTGCGTSAMSGGHSQLHKNLEKRFAQILCKEECLLFPTGFTANTGTIAALCKGSETLIIIDRDSHASIIDGCRASQSKYIPFKHNSVQDLEQKLKRYSTKYVNLLVVIESAYSMEGDIAPLEKIVALKDKYNFLLYVDEAHTFGFYGKNGSGLCNQLGVADDVDFIMTTLSKSTASIGGIILSARAIVNEAVETYAHIDMAHASMISVVGDDFQILGDPTMIKYILYNLIQNALWHIKNKPDAEIIISVRISKNDGHYIEVKDTGPGIEPEVIPHLFDNFYTTNKQGGTGLGLAYCNRTMMALGGNIDCHSKLGKYTAFVLSFPQ
jgi:7-keto-8-aminopelargonate synthetase-like enzyme